MSSHPTDRELSALLDGSVDPALQSHIDECAYCRSRLRAAGPAIAVPAEVTIEARRIDLPTPVTDALPERGDVWRLAWEDVRDLAVVVGVGDDGISVAPLFDDPDDVADEWTLTHSRPLQSNRSVRSWHPDGRCGCARLPWFDGRG